MNKIWFSQTPLPPKVWFVHLWKCWHLWTIPKGYYTYMYIINQHGVKFAKTPKK